LDYFGRRADDGVSRQICVKHHLACRNAHRRKPPYLRPRVASCVTLRPITEVVAYSVDLDHKARLRAKEVKHVGPDRVLTTEDWRSWLPLAQSDPRSRLRRGKIAAKSPRKSHRFFRRPHGRQPPPPSFGRSPSPASRARIAPSASLFRPLWRVVIVPGVPPCAGRRKSAQAAEGAPSRRSSRSS
jgi:hypothetical protein